MNVGFKFVKIADVHSREVRSFNMSRIKGKDTKPELLLRKFLFHKDFSIVCMIKNNYLVPAFRSHSDSSKPTRERVDA
ncbi:TPA: hypothetical protein ACG0AO_003409 [Elizabethkingia meningoseptica]